MLVMKAFYTNEVKELLYPIVCYSRDILKDKIICLNLKTYTNPTHYYSEVLKGFNMESKNFYLQINFYLLLMFKIPL